MSLEGKCVLVLKKTQEHEGMLTTTVQKQHSKNRVTVLCKSLRIHDYLVSVLGRSTVL